MVGGDDRAPLAGHVSRPRTAMLPEEAVARPQQGLGHGIEAVLGAVRRSGGGRVTSSVLLGARAAAALCRRRCPRDVEAVFPSETGRWQRRRGLTNRRAPVRLRRCSGAVTLTPCEILVAAGPMSASSCRREAVHRVGGGGSTRRAARHRSGGRLRVASHVRRSTLPVALRGSSSTNVDVAGHLVAGQPVVDVVPHSSAAARAPGRHSTTHAARRWPNSRRPRRPPPPPRSAGWAASRSSTSRGTRSRRRTRSCRRPGRPRRAGLAVDVAEVAGRHEAADAGPWCRRRCSRRSGCALPTKIAPHLRRRAAVGPSPSRIATVEPRAARPAVPGAARRSAGPAIVAWPTSVEP